MELQSKILELISLLDENNDFFLILLLTEKLEKENKDLLIAEYKDFTAIEKGMAKSGIKRTLNSYLSDDTFKDKREIRLWRLLTLRNCSGCKYESNYADSIVCEMCDKRHEKIFNLAHEYSLQRRDFVDKFVKNLPDEILYQKILINKINTKLHNIINQFNF